MKESVGGFWKDSMKDFVRASVTYSVKDSAMDSVRHSICILRGIR